MASRLIAHRSLGCSQRSQVSSRDGKPPPCLSISSFKILSQLDCGSGKDVIGMRSHFTPLHQSSRNVAALKLNTTSFDVRCSVSHSMSVHTRMPSSGIRTTTQQ